MRTTNRSWLSPPRAPRWRGRGHGCAARRYPAASRCRWKGKSFVTGKEVSDTEFLSTLSAEERERLASLVADNFASQILTDGFYHADPHSGNVLIKETDPEVLKAEADENDKPNQICDENSIINDKCKCEKCGEHTTVDVDKTSETYNTCICNLALEINKDKEGINGNI